MKIIRLIFVLILTTLMALAAEIEDGYLKITYHSISNYDTVHYSSGLIVRFSEPINFASFNADTIIYIEVFYEEEYHVDSSKIFVDKAENVTLNGTPLSFWYDNNTYTCALIKETTEDYQDGTGRGFIIGTENIFKIKNVESINGNRLNNSFELTFQGNNEMGFSLVPNPFIYPSIWQTIWQNEILPLAIFIHLSTICTIYISNIDDDTINVINHFDEISEIEKWNLSDSNGNTMSSGVYRYEVKDSIETVFKHGVMFIVLPESEMSITNREGISTIFSLKQNYPNPFNSITKIQYNLPTSGFVKLSIYNLLGKELIRLKECHEEAGYKTITWNGKNRDGEEVPTGVYFYSVEFGESHLTKKMLLIK